jgi:RimJ/RimL family protein N-acetyltransferase
MNLTRITLANDHVRLISLEPVHREALRAAASDPAIWRHWPRAIIGEAFDAHFNWQLEEHAAGRWQIYSVVTLGSSGMTGADPIIGQTCFLNIRPDHSGVEVGGTWYAPQAQGGLINPACKLLMLGHAFACGAERVELKTDAENARSRAAILKLGATFEGVFRRHMRRMDGTWRDTAWYSVLRDEWPAVQAGLRQRLTPT